MSLRDGDVISLEALKVLTRRDFVRATGVGLVTIALPACGGEMMAGPADMAAPADDLARAPDIAMSNPDIAMSKPDIAMSQPDLVMQDMAAPRDMAMQPADMAQTPADMAQRPADMSMQPADMAQTPADMAQKPADMAQTPADLAQRPDMAQSPPDMAGACGPNAVDSGMRGPNFAANTATFLAKPRVFICRDKFGLYAVSSICTHAGCDVNEAAPAGFNCPCHGSAYDFDGNVTMGPAGQALVHFALCLVGNGNVGVDTTMMVATNQRYPY